MSPNPFTITEADHRLLEHTILARERLEEPYADLAQQNQTASFGMWLFLATEIMFFGSLFVAFQVYRFLYPGAFELASSRLNWQIGSVNTFVLLISSLTMAMAVYYVRINRTRALVSCLLTTAVLGAAFLGLKAYEYYDDFEQGLILGARFDEAAWTSVGLTREDTTHVRLFLLFYWIMTGAHAVHMIIGITAVLIIAMLAGGGTFDDRYYGPVEATGFYWHFVDVVWIFLLPTLYLLGSHRL
jgi:cytochrome c oxidase subunit 3